MAEMLKVVMMSQSSMDPVPIQYNSCILHVLEAYNDLRVQMLTKDEALKILKQNHARDIKDFEELANSWQIKEKDYQVEVKRLEVLLSKTEGGMEMVSLARSNSSIHGSQKAAETIRKGIGSIKDRNRDGSKLPRTQALALGNNLVADKLEYRGTPEVHPAPNDNQCMAIRHSESQYQRNLFADIILFPKAFHSFRSGESRDSEYKTALHSRPSRVPGHPRNMYAQSSSRSMQSSEDSEQKDILNRGLGAPASGSRGQERFDRVEQELGSSFELSTDSNEDSSSVSVNEEGAANDLRPVFGLGIQDKPLPEVPLDDEDRAKQTTLDRFLALKNDTALEDSLPPAPPRQMGFSFKVDSFSPQTSYCCIVSFSLLVLLIRSTIHGLLLDPSISELY
jgi:hypothetical protein